ALLKKNYQALILHGDTEQKRREDIMRAFKSQKRGILVATDLAGRGLDVSDVTHVINFQIPWNQDSYVHRIGRTGRAGRSGIAMSLVTKSQVRTIQGWAKRTGSELKFSEI